VSRRRKLFVFALVVVATLLYALWRLPDWGARLLESTLEGQFRRAVRIESLRVRPATLELELRGLRVAGPTDDAPPFLEVGVVRVRPSLAPLRGNRIVLSRVRIERPRLRIEAYPGPPLGPGGDNIPKLGGGRGGSVQVRVARLVVVGGEFVLDHARVPLDLDLPNFQGRFTAGPSGGLAGHLSFGTGRLRMGDAPELPVGTEIDATYQRGLLSVDGGRLTAEGTTIDYSGRLRLAGRPQGQLRLVGGVDLAVLERHVFRSGLGFAGTARWDGILSIDGSRLRIEGRMQGSGGQFMTAAIPRFAGALSYDGTSGLVLRDLDVEALSGTARLAIDVPPAATLRPLHIAGPLRDADSEALLRLVFGWGEMGVGTAASGEVDVSWPRGAARRLSGRVGLDLAQRADGRFPVSGRVDWSAQDGAQAFERVELRGPGLQAQVAGTVDAQDRAELALEGETADIAAADALLVRLRRALGSAEAQPAGFAGRGSFTGRWRGTLEWPVFDGRFSGSGIGYAGVEWGRAQWTGAFDTRAESVESHPLVLTKERGSLTWEGRTQTGWFGQSDALSGRARVESWPVADLVRFMEWDVAASGTASGEAVVRGRRSAPEGEARIVARDGKYQGVPYETARIDSRWSDRVAEVTSGEVLTGGGRVLFRGSVTDDGAYDGSAEMQDVDVGALAPGPKAGIAYGGRLSGRAVLQGTLARPRLAATLRSPRLFVGDEGVGALEARVSGAGDGRVAIDGRCRSARVDLALAGTVGATEPFEADLTLTARSTSVDPYLRVAQPTLPSALAIVASGEARIRGPLATPAEVRAEASVPELQVLLPEFASRASEPVRLTYADGRVDLALFHLAGEGTDLVVRGGADLLGDGPLAVSARGQADLRAVSVVSRRLRGSGAARLAVEVSGTRGAPRVAGTLELDGASLRVRGFPHGVEGLRGRVRFNEKAAALEGVGGTLAGGRLTIEGEASYAGGRLLSYDVRPVGRGMALRYPEGLRSVVDAQLRLFGDAARQWITGTLDVRQALWTRRYDVASEILAGRRPAPGPADAATLEEGAQLDLRVRVPGTLRIDNNLASLSARADLALSGTSRAPVVTGRAEIERGQLYFQGRTYLVQRGTLDFVNPQRLDPLFDIEAVTRIRSYSVTLRVSGTLERVTPTLSSDPPLSSLQILALLAGQDESEVASLTQTQARQSQAQIAATGAATLAAGRISESVGLEREAERLFGLNRFSIDPSLLRGAGTAPTARVTVGKRFAPNLNVLYSQDLRGTEERILAVEYNLSDRFSLLLTRTDPGTAKTGVERGWAFDVRLRQSR
jgi:autotransporter translocation and assembly factor TamB